MRREALWRGGALIVSGLALLGCATPITYGPISPESHGFGYSETTNPDGSHTIRTVAPSAAQAHEFWDRRASELCAGAAYRKNIFRAEIPVELYTGYAAGPNGYGGSYTEHRYGALILEGHAHCEGEPEQANLSDTAAPQAVSAPAESQP